MIRCMIVDDSFLARTAIEKVLKTDANIEVVGMAANGKEALELIPVLKPTVITCDMEMPVMDGIQTLMAVRKQFPEIKVIVLSSITQEHSAKTLLCKNLGAFEIMAKPEAHSNLMAADNSDQLIENIHRSEVA